MGNASGMWRFSDGTEVEPGGVIRGDSVFAQRLRVWLPGASTTIWAQPSSAVDVDPNDTGLLNAWLNEMLDRENRIEKNPVKLTQRHDDVSELPPPPWAGKELPSDVQF